MKKLITIIAMILCLSINLRATQITLLDEHFNYDQRVPALRWPWNTPPQNPNFRWHYNPYDPYLRAEGAFRSNYCWGWQNYIFNIRVTPQVDFQGSLWCAYTNRSDVNNPRWPEDDYYGNDQNAWTWWGPFNLRNIVSANVSFWTYIDLVYGCQDSLSVVCRDHDDYMTRNGNDFRSQLFFTWETDPTNPTIGHLLTFPRNTSSVWERHEFSFSELRRLNNNGQIIDTLNAVGIFPEMWVAFVWQSNFRDSSGIGAFIDDVMVVIDDGLFELTPVSMFYGYKNGEEISWTDILPRMNDSVYFKFNWKATGRNALIGPLNIKAFINNDEIFSNNYQVEVGSDTIFSAYTESPWIATHGNHHLRWELDTPVNAGGMVEETDENNNVLGTDFEVVWNPPPIFSVRTPIEDSTEVPMNMMYPLWYDVIDSNATDSSFVIYLYWTDDTTGFWENPDTLFTYHYIAHDFTSPIGLSSLEWNIARDHYIRPEQVVYIIGFAADGYPGNRTIAIAPGRIWIRGLSIDEKNTVDDYAIIDAYPNPFNQTINISFSLKHAQNIRIEVFDLNGKNIILLVNGVLNSGKHFIKWVPSNNVVSGIYLLSFNKGDKIDTRKIIYLR